MGSSVERDIDTDTTSDSGARLAAARAHGKFFGQQGLVSGSAAA